MKTKRDMMDKRFHYYPFSQEIVDELTNKRYYGSKDLCILLNQENDRANRNAELLYKENPEYMMLVWQKDIYENFSNEVLKIMRKYNVDTLKKLDLVLWNGRIW